MNGAKKSDEWKRLMIAEIARHIGACDNLLRELYQHLESEE